jgi:hypothetical protein
VFLINLRAYNASTNATTHEDAAWVTVYNNVVTVTPVNNAAATDFIVNTDTTDRLRIWYDATNTRLTITNLMGASGVEKAEVVITNMTA